MIDIETMTAQEMIDQCSARANRDQHIDSAVTGNERAQHYSVMSGHLQGVIAALVQQRDGITE